MCPHSKEQNTGEKHETSVFFQKIGVYLRYFVNKTVNFSGAAFLLDRQKRSLTKYLKISTYICSKKYV